MYLLLCVLPVSAEEGAESSECIEEAYGEGSHEVVTGTREDTPFSDTSSDDTRHASPDIFSFFARNFDGPLSKV